MAHEITVRKDGFAEAAFSLEPAWHGLGQVWHEPMTSVQALTLAGLDWEVVQRNLAMQNDDQSYTEIEGLLANVRGDNGYFLGTVSENYVVVQNTEAFDFVDALVDDGSIRYESAFSLQGGKKVVLLARLPEADYITEDDKLLRYVLMSLHHDGTGAIKFGPTSVRVVCANTYALALGKGGIQEMAIRHKGDVKSKLDAAKRILGMAQHEFDKHNEQARQLAEKRLTIQEWEAFLNIMCPIPDKLDPDYTERRAARLDETRAAIQEAFNNERQNLPGIERSAWAAYCAVSEHIDHLPRRGATMRQKAETRFNVTLAGPGRDMKERAFQTALRFAGLVQQGA